MESLFEFDNPVIQFINLELHPGVLEPFFLHLVRLLWGVLDPCNCTVVKIWQVVMLSLPKLELLNLLLQSQATNCIFFLLLM